MSKVNILNLSKSSDISIPKLDTLLNNNNFIYSIFFNKCNLDNIYDHNFLTPLHYLCSNENITIQLLEYFLKYGSNINAKTFYDATPLHYLCSNKNITPTLLNFFIDNHNFNKYEVCDRITHKNPLHELCSNENITIELLNIMIQSGFNINQCNIENNTPLHFLCSNKNITLELLIHMFNNNCNFNIENIYGYTPIYNLCENNNITLDLFKFIVKKTSSYNIVNNNGYSILSKLFKNTNTNIFIDKNFIDFIEYDILLCNSHLLNVENIENKTLTPLNNLCRNIHIPIKCKLQIINRLIRYCKNNIIKISINDIYINRENIYSIEDQNLLKNYLEEYLNTKKNKIIL